MGDDLARFLEELDLPEAASEPTPLGAQYAEDSELLDFLNDAADSAAAICDLSDIGISDGRIELPTEQGKYNKQGDRAVDEDQHQTEGAVELAVVEEKAGILTRPDVVEEDHEQARSFRHTQDFSVDKSLNTDGFLFDPDEATVEGFDIDEVVGDGLIMGDEKYGHCYFTDFEDELPVITADENNDILIMEMAYQRLEYVVDPSTAHFRDTEEQFFFRSVGATTPSPDVFCPKNIMIGSGEIHYADASSIQRVLISCATSPKKKSDQNKSHSDQELLSSCHQQDDVLEMCDEDDLNLSNAPVYANFSLSEKPEQNDESKAVFAVWCAARRLQMSTQHSSNDDEAFESSGTNMSSTYGEDEALAPSGHDAAKITSHQATMVAAPAKTGKSAVIDISVLPSVYRVLEKYPRSVDLGAGALALITELWARHFDAGISHSEANIKYVRKEQQRLISSAALDIVLLVFRSCTKYLDENLDASESSVAPQILCLLEQSCVFITVVCKCNCDKELRVMMRRKLTGMLRVEAWFCKSLSVICSAKAQGKLGGDDNLKGVNPVERAFATYCQTGIALSLNYESKCLLVDPPPLQDQRLNSIAKPGDGATVVLCTVLALYATSPLVVMWVARLTHALVHMKPGEGNYVKEDKVSAQNDHNVNSDTAALCQSLAASTLVFHGKLLTQRPLFSCGRSNSKNIDNTDDELESMHLAALHTNYNDYLRLSCVYWGLQAVGGLTFGRKIVLFSRIATSTSLNDTVISIPSSNRKFIEEINAVESIVSIFKAAVFDILDGWTQPEVEGWSRNRGYSDIGIVSIAEASDDSTTAMSNGLRLVQACGWCLNSICTDCESVVNKCIEVGICEMIGQVLSFLYLGNVKKDMYNGVIRELSLLIAILATSKSGIKEFEKETNLVMKSLGLLINGISRSNHLKESSVSCLTYLWLAVNSILIYEFECILSIEKSPWGEARRVKPVLLCKLVNMDPFDAIADTLVILHTSISAMKSVLRVLALLVRTSKDIAVSAIQSALVQPLVNVLAKYVDDAEVTYLGCVALTALLGVSAGKKAFLHTSPISGIDVLVIIMTRYMVHGNYGSKISDDINTEDIVSDVTCHLQLHSSLEETNDVTAPRGVAIIAPLSNLRNTSRHDVLLAAVVCITHFSLIPADLDDSSPDISNSFLTYNFADALAVLHRIGQSGAVKVVPKLLCQCLHDVATALEASQHVTTIAQLKQTENSNFAKPVQYYHLDLKLCKWLCRAIGAIGGVSPFDFREQIAQRRLFNNIIEATTLTKNLSFDQIILSSASKMGMVMEVFEALLILAKYTYELTRLSLKFSQHSGGDEHFRLVSSAKSMTESVSMAVNALSILPENRNRMRSLFLTTLSGISPQRKPSGLNVFKLLLDQLYIVERERLEDNNKGLFISGLRRSIRHSICGVICNMYMASDVSVSTSASALDDDFSTSVLSTTLSNCTKEIMNSNSTACSPDVVNVICSVLFAIVATTYRHLSNVQRYAKGGKCDDSVVLTSLLRLLELCRDRCYGTLSLLCILVCISFSDISSPVRKFFMRHGIFDFLNFHLESPYSDLKQPRMYQMSNYSRASEFRVCVIARLISSFTIQSSGDMNRMKSASFYYKMFGNSDSVGSKHALLSGVNSSIKQKQFKYFAAANSVEMLNTADNKFSGTPASKTAFSAISSAGSILLDKASGIYASMSSSHSGGAAMKSDALNRNDKNMFNSRGDLTFNQVEGLYSVDLPFHELKVTGASASGDKLLHNEDVEYDTTDVCEDTDDQFDIVGCMLGTGLIEDVLREYKKLPTHNNTTKTADSDSWKEHSLLLAIASMASFDTRIQARLSTHPQLLSLLASSLMNPAYLVHRDDKDNRREMVDSKSEHALLFDKGYNWKYVCVSSRVAVVKNALLALASLALGNTDNIEELGHSDIMNGLIVSCPLYLAYCESIAWAYSKLLCAVASGSEEFAFSAPTLVDYLLLVLSKHLNSPRVCYWGLKALNLLFRKHVMCLEVLKEQNSVVKTVLGVLQRQGSVAAVAQNGCEVLQRLLLFDFGVFELLKRSGIDVIIACFHRHREDLDVICSCCKILREILVGTPRLPTKNPGEERIRDADEFERVDVVPSLSIENNIIISAGSTAKELIPFSERSTLRLHLLSGGICEVMLDILAMRAIERDVEAINHAPGNSEIVILLLSCLLGLLDQNNASCHLEGIMNTSTSRSSSDLSAINCKERMIQHGVFEILPAVLKRHADSVGVLIIWSNVVCHFVLGNENFARKLIQNTELSETLSIVLENNSTIAAAVEAVCQVVNALCLVRENRIRMGYGGVCSAVISALKKNDSPSSLQFYCLLALGSLAHDVHTNVLTIATEEVLTIVQRIASAHAVDNSVAWSLCRVVSYLAEESAALIAAGTYSLIVVLLQSRLQDKSSHIDENGAEKITSETLHNDGFNSALVVEWSCRCIGCVAINSESRLALGSAGACEAIVNALHIYTPTSVYITREGILALSCLCDTRAAIPNIDRLQDLGGQVAVKAIQKYFDDTEVCWCCCKLLISLSIRPAYLVNASAGDFVISIMQKHYNNSLVTDWGCRALSSLAVDDKYRDILIGDGASDAIAQALTVAVSSESILSAVVYKISSIQNIAGKLGIAGGNSFLTKSALGASACNSIFSLADRHFDFRQQLGDAGACESVVKVLIKFSGESSDVAGAACHAIIALCRDSPKNRNKIGIAGGCKAIINVLQKYASDENVSIHALRCLTALIPDSIYMELNGEYSNSGGEPVSRFEERQKKTNASMNGALFRDPGAVQLPSRIESSRDDQKLSSIEASTENRRYNLSKFTATESCEAIALVLQSHQSSDNIARIGCWTVALLANSGDDVLIKLNVVGACESVVSMLQRHLRSNTICQSGCVALARLAVNPGNSGWLGAAGGCNVALDAVRYHPNDYMTSWTAWAAISSLALDEGNRSRFFNMNICQVVVTDLTRFVKSLDGFGTETVAESKFEVEVENENKEEATKTESGEICLVCEECCHAVAILAQDKEIFQLFHNLSTGDVIVRILLTPNITPGLCAVALGALTSLVGTSAATKDALCDAGACEAVVMALKRHAIYDGGDALVSIQGAISMYSMAYRHNNNQMLLGGAGGCEVLLNLLRKYGWTEAVSEHVCRAVNSIILDNVDNQLRMANAGACSIILASMKVHILSPVAVNRGACALFNLAVDNEACREQCWTSDGCSILDSCLGRHLNNEPVCVRIALVVKTLAFDVDGQNKLAETGICRLLVKALNVHESSATGCPLLLSVIGAVALGHQRNQSNINLNGGCKAIVSACQRHIRDEGVVIEACRAILALGDENDDCKNKLASVGAADLANTILGIYDQKRVRFERKTKQNSSEEIDENEEDLYNEVLELAKSCQGMLAGKAPSSFFSRHFGF